MTDHDRLCELLERAYGRSDSPAFYDAIWKMLARLRSNGPDGLRVVPVKPTKKKTLNEQIVDAKKEIAGWNKERKAGVQLEGIDEAMLRAGGSRPMTDEHADKTDPYDLSAGDERDDG